MTRDPLYLTTAALALLMALLTSWASWRTPRRRTALPDLPFALAAVGMACYGAYALLGAQDAPLRWAWAACMLPAAARQGRELLRERRSH